MLCVHSVSICVRVCVSTCVCVCAPLSSDVHVQAEGARDVPAATRFHAHHSLLYGNHRPKELTGEVIASLLSSASYVLAWHCQGEVRPRLFVSSVQSVEICVALLLSHELKLQMMGKQPYGCQFRVCYHVFRRPYTLFQSVLYVQAGKTDSSSSFEEFDDYAAFAMARMRQTKAAGKADVTDGTTPNIPLDDVVESVQKQRVNIMAWVEVCVL